MGVHQIGALFDLRACGTAHRSPESNQRLPTGGVANRVLHIAPVGHGFLSRCGIADPSYRNTFEVAGPDFSQVTRRQHPDVVAPGDECVGQGRKEGAGDITGPTRKIVSEENDAH